MPTQWPGENQNILNTHHTVPVCNALFNPWWCLKHLKKNVCKMPGEKVGYRNLNIAASDHIETLNNLHLQAKTLAFECIHSALALTKILNKKKSQMPWAWMLCLPGAMLRYAAYSINWLSHHLKWIIMCLSTKIQTDTDLHFRGKRRAL